MNQDEIIEAVKVLDEADVPKDGRVAAFIPEMWSQKLVDQIMQESVFSNILGANKMEMGHTGTNINAVFVAILADDEDKGSAFKYAAEMWWGTKYGEYLPAQLVVVTCQECMTGIHFDYYMPLGDPHVMDPKAWAAWKKLNRERAQRMDTPESFRALMEKLRTEPSRVVNHQSDDQLDAQSAATSATVAVTMPGTGSLPSRPGAVVLDPPA